MSPERRAELVRTLEESGRVFHAAAAGFSEERARLSPGPDRWCVAEVVEHVAVVETNLFRMLSAASLEADSSEEHLTGDPAKEAMLVARVENRERRGQAPERARPSGRFATLPEALGHFAAARQQTICFAEETQADLFRVTVRHPVFGTVNGYELLLIMAGHPRRHAEQIAEIKSSLG